MKLTYAVLALSAVWPACGCGGKDQNATASDVKGASADLKELTADNVFPMKTGNEWVYELRGRSSQGNGSAEALFKMTKVDVGPDGTKTATVEISLDNKLSERQTWVLNKEGLFQTAGGNKLTPFSPPQPAVLFPFKEGAKFSWSGTGPMPVGGANNAKLDNVVLGRELVDTGTKPMWAWAIETTGHFTVSLHETGKPAQDAEAVQVTDSWWCPDKGFIRSKTKVSVPGVQENEQTLTLKSFSPGK